MQPVDLAFAAFFRAVTALALVAAGSADVFADVLADAFADAFDDVGFDTSLLTSLVF